MALLRWTLGFLIASAVVAFAVTNRQPVDVHWSPFNAPLQLPLYQVTLGLTAFGFLAGSLIVWLGTIPLRLAARRQKNQLKKLEKQLDAPHNGEPVNDSALLSLPFSRDKAR